MCLRTDARAVGVCQHRAMRCFVSLPVSEDTRDHLDDYLEPRRRAEGALRWSDPERWHVTLAFMPDVAEVDLGDLGERLEVACARRRPFTVGIRGGGVFGGAFSARVLWAGLGLSDEDREELDRLAVGARNAAAAAGTVVEGGEFVPHLTVARSPRPRDLRHLLDVLDLYDGPTWRVETIDLVGSHLGGGSVRHEVIGTYPLGTPDQEQGVAWWRRGYLSR